MKGLAIIAHGSRAEAANSEFQQQVANTMSLLNQHYPLITHCFLELATPSLNDACQDLAAQGATSIDVYPLFFNRGKHVSVDIPKLVEGAQHHLDKVPVRLFRYFGAGDALSATIANDILAQANS